MSSASVLPAITRGREEAFRILRMSSSALKRQKMVAIDVIKPLLQQFTLSERSYIMPALNQACSGNEAPELYAKLQSKLELSKLDALCHNFALLTIHRGVHLSDTKPASLLELESSLDPIEQLKKEHGLIKILSQEILKFFNPNTVEQFLQLSQEARTSILDYVNRRIEWAKYSNLFSISPSLMKEIADSYTYEHPGSKGLALLLDEVLSGKNRIRIAYTPDLTFTISAQNQSRMLCYCHQGSILRIPIPQEIRPCQLIDSVSDMRSHLEIRIPDQNGYWCVFPYTEDLFKQKLSEIYIGITALTVVDQRGSHTLRGEQEEMALVTSLFVKGVAAIVDGTLCYLEEAKLLMKPVDETGRLGLEAYDVTDFLEAFRSLPFTSAKIVEVSERNLVIEDAKKIKYEFPVNDHKVSREGCVCRMEIPSSTFYMELLPEGSQFTVLAGKVIASCRKIQKETGETEIKITLIQESDGMNWVLPELPEATRFRQRKGDPLSAASLATRFCFDFNNIDPTTCLVMRDKLRAQFIIATQSLSLSNAQRRNALEYFTCLLRNTSHYLRIAMLLELSRLVFLFQEQGTIPDEKKLALFSSGGEFSISPGCMASRPSRLQNAVEQLSQGSVFAVNQFLASRNELLDTLTVLFLEEAQKRNQPIPRSMEVHTKPFFANRLKENFHFDTSFTSEDPFAQFVPGQQGGRIQAAWQTWGETWFQETFLRLKTHVISSSAQQIYQQLILNLLPFINRIVKTEDFSSSGFNQARELFMQFNIDLASEYLEWDDKRTAFHVDGIKLLKDLSEKVKGHLRDLGEIPIEEPVFEAAGSQ